MLHSQMIVSCVQYLLQILTSAYSSCSKGIENLNKVPSLRIRRMLSTFTRGSSHYTPVSSDETTQECVPASLGEQSIFTVEI